jgi:hypothetical protein
MSRPPRPLPAPMIALRPSGSGNPADAIALRARHPSSRPSPPLVSILTPTFNRRPWIPQLVRCVLGQTWIASPARRAEWIILDDGTDPIRDLLPAPMTRSAPPNLDIRYERPETRLPLGEKRNRLHALARGDIAVYFDDDDYHFPTRIEHSVRALLKHPKALAAGCTELPIWFLPENSLGVIGPFARSHATCGTMAVRRELFTRRSFEPGALMAEEAAFLDAWRVPLVQLDPWRVILCVAHAANTVEKRAVRDRMLAAEAAEQKPSRWRTCTAPALKLVADAASRDFYRAIARIPPPGSATASASPSPSAQISSSEPS